MRWKLSIFFLSGIKMAYLPKNAPKGDAGPDCTYLVVSRLGEKYYYSKAHTKTKFMTLCPRFFNLSKVIFSGLLRSSQEGPI